MRGELYNYDYAWGLMEVNYPYLYVGEHAGIDYKEVKKRYRNTIENSSDLTYKEFYNIMSRCIGTKIDWTFVLS